MSTNDNIFKFKTNIKCDGCIAKVKPLLDEANGILNWEVDTNDSDKILSVNSDGISAEEIMEKVKEAGFKIVVK